eukprot:1756909-Rhodomonas_salina.2
MEALRASIVIVIREAPHARMDRGSLRLRRTAALGLEDSGGCDGGGPRREGGLSYSEPGLLWGGRERRGKRSCETLSAPLSLTRRHVSVSLRAAGQREPEDFGGDTVT